MQKVNENSVMPTSKPLINSSKPVVINRTTHTKPASSSIEYLEVRPGILVRTCEDVKPDCVDE